VEAREGRRRCSPLPRRRRRRCLESDAAIAEVREGQGFGVWTSDLSTGEWEGRASAHRAILHFFWPFGVGILTEISRMKD
jgi:hypothetical protein